VTEEGRHEGGRQHRDHHERPRNGEADQQGGVVAAPLQRKEDQRLGQPEVGYNIGKGDEDQRESDDAKCGRLEQMGQDCGRHQHQSLAGEKRHGLPGDAVNGSPCQPATDRGPSPVCRRASGKG